VESILLWNVCVALTEEMKCIQKFGREAPWKAVIQTEKMRDADWFIYHLTTLFQLQKLYIARIIIAIIISIIVVITWGFWSRESWPIWMYYSGIGVRKIKKSLRIAGMPAGIRSLYHRNRLWIWSLMCTGGFLLQTLGQFPMAVAH
jgi:hypothetical protein